MDQASCSSLSILHCALELSKNSWVLAIQFADREQPSLYPFQGGETEKLMAKLAAAQNCCAKPSGVLPVITLCYEVGYDAFWLARFLQARGIQCVVIDPGSLQVNRRGRPVKTDRVDVKVLLRTPIVKTLPNMIPSKTETMALFMWRNRLADVGSRFARSVTLPNSKFSERPQCTGAFRG